MELAFNFMDVLHKIHHEPGVLVAFAAFHPFIFIVLLPFLWILKKTGLYVPKTRTGLFGFGIICIIAMGWLMGFASQILLFFMGISGLKMFLIYIAMYLCITAFTISNIRGLNKQFQTYELKKGKS